MTLYVAQGIVLTAAAVTLVSFQQERMAASSAAHRAAVVVAAPRARLPARPTRTRTGLTVAMYALVVFILTFITTLAHMIDSEVRPRPRTSAAALPRRLLQRRQSDRAGAGGGARRRHPRRAARDARRPSSGSTAERRHPLERRPPSTSRFLRGGPPKLEDRGSYPTDRAAWQAVSATRGSSIVDPAFLQNSGGPPDFEAEPGTQDLT